MFSSNKKILLNDYSMLSLPYIINKLFPLFSMINFFLPLRSFLSTQKLDFVTNFYLPTSMTYCAVIYSCSTCPSIQMNNDNDLCILRFKTFHQKSYVTCYAFDYLLSLEQILSCQHNQFLLEFFVGFQC